MAKSTDNGPASAAAEKPPVEALEPAEATTAPDEAADAPEAPESAPDADPVAENIIDGLIDGDTPVPMSHPDGGACDLYKADKAGNLLVPAADVPAMQAHGFVVAGAE